MYSSSSTPGVQQYAPQYITEILFSRQEAKHNRVLTARFWSSSKEWKKRYRTSLMFVRKFLKIHSEEATIAALQSYEGRTIAYLQDKRLVRLVEKEQAKIDALLSNLANVPEPVKVNEEARPMKAYGKQTALSKLRELDGERERRESSED